MKFFKLPAVLLVISLLFTVIYSCKKDPGEVRETLPGTWRLTEAKLSTGSGPGNWVKVPDDQEVKLIINQNGSVSGDVFTDVESFTVVDATHLQVKLKGDNADQPVTFIYSLSNVLEIQGVCFEGCRYRFNKVK